MLHKMLHMSRFNLRNVQARHYKKSILIWIYENHFEWRRAKANANVISMCLLAAEWKWNVIEVPYNAFVVCVDRLVVVFLPVVLLWCQLNNKSRANQGNKREQLSLEAFLSLGVMHLSAARCVLSRKVNYPRISMSHLRAHRAPSR